MIATEKQLARVSADWSRLVQEPVAVEQINGDFYAYGSELACLRLFYKFRSVSGARAEYSKNLSTWYFTKPSTL